MCKHETYTYAIDFESTRHGPSWTGPYGGGFALNRYCRDCKKPMGYIHKDIDEGDWTMEFDGLDTLNWKGI